MASVAFEHVAVSADRTVLLDGVTLSIADGAVAAIVGPSGSGKSSLLRSIAGLTRISSGRLAIGGRDLTTRAPGDRDVSMVFQESALLPRRTARGNVEFPLEIRRETLDAIRQRVDAEARAMHIEHLLEKTPGTLSRGEEQLVQIARALVRVPQVLLLDEPFAPLDEPRRRTLRSELRVLQQGYGVTTVIATNDPEDALRLADTVIALDRPRGTRPGRVVQVGSISEVRDAPATIDAAASLGDLWQVEARVESGPGGVWLVGIDDPSFRHRGWSPALEPLRGRRVSIGTRSDAVVPSPTGAHRATVRRVVPGSDPRLVLELAGHLVLSTRVDGQSVGEELRVDLVEPFVFDEDGVRVA